MSIFSKKTPTTDITRDIELATQPTLVEEDWSIIFHICQQVNTVEFGGKEARKALQKKLNSNVPRIQLHVFTILKALTENSELRFRDQIIAKSFLKDLEKLMTSTSTDPGVHQSGIECIQMWASYYKNMAEMVAISDLYRRVAPRIPRQPHLPAISRTPTHPSPQPLWQNSMTGHQNYQQQLPIHEQLRQAAIQASVNNLQYSIASDIEVCRNNVALLSEMLAFTDPSQEDISKNELIQEFYAQCKGSQLTISQHMQHSGDPETLSTLLESYNEVKKVFDSYKEMLEHGNYHRARAASEKVSHRGTGELALIDFESKGNTQSDMPAGSSDYVAGSSSSNHLFPPEPPAHEMADVDPFSDPTECDIPILQTKSTKAQGKQKVPELSAAPPAQIVQE